MTSSFSRPTATRPSPFTRPTTTRSPRRRVLPLRFVAIASLVISFSFTYYQYFFFQGQSSGTIPYTEPPSTGSTFSFKRFHKCEIHKVEQIFATAPHVLIIGAQKSGTRALYAFLDQSRQVTTKGRRNEQHFFDQDEMFLEHRHQLYDPNVLCSLQKHYAYDYFDQQALQARRFLAVDKTPDYLIHKGTPEATREVLPWGVKIVVLLKNPVYRAFSQYRLNFERRYDQRPFGDVLKSEIKWLKDHNWIPQDTPDFYEDVEDYSNYTFRVLEPRPVVQADVSGDLRHRLILARGMYALQLSSWSKIYNMKDIKIVVQEHLEEKPQLVMDEIAEFLNLESFEVPKSLSDRHFTHKAPGNLVQNFTLAEQKYLKLFYEPYNELMKEIIPGMVENFWD